MPLAIEVSHLTKEYRLGAMRSLGQTLRNTGSRLLGRTVDERPPFKALDDVNFNIEQGEVVGIIGHNGAGKSTLLKMLARISTPTRGSVAIHGRVSPLIEVGAGFVPDFTGRENIYLNGSILGMPKKQIARKFDEIVDFAGMAEFIDTPVKRYSSGMQVKLAFAVATSVESEILIVDEVLAVGDLAFQRKCFDRMEDLIKRRGRTVLLVSHNIRQVERLCSRVLLMKRGKVVRDGESSEVCNLFYEASDRDIQASQSTSMLGRFESSDDVDLTAIEILDEFGTPLASVEHLQNIELRLGLDVKKALPDPTFGVGLHTTDFFYLATCQSLGMLKPGVLQPGKYQLHFKIRSFPFLPGTYSFRLGIALSSSFHPVFYCENLSPFQVTSKNVSRATLGGQQEGFIALDGEWALLAESPKTKITA